MKKHILLMASISLLCASHNAQAQPVESEALGPARYTLKNETDPMALGASDMRLPGQDAALPAEPPPATDYQPSQYTPPIDEPAAAQDQAPAPAAEPYTPPDLNKYRNNVVSGVPPRDPHEFDNKVFCTMSVTFDTIGKGFDAATDKQVNAYLESNKDKLTVIRKDRKSGGHSYCIVVPEQGNRANIYKSLKRLIPLTNSAKPSVTLTSEMFAPIGGAGRATYRD